MVIVPESARKLKAFIGQTRLSELTRFMARPRWQKHDFNEPLMRMLLAKEKKRGKFIFIIDATLVSQSGKKTQNTFSTGNRTRCNIKKGFRYNKKKVVRKNVHSFTFGLLITPSGIRIPMQIAHLTEEYCKENQRFTNPREHEVYSMGHLLTAACMHQRITGKDSLMKVAVRNADFLCENLGEKVWPSYAHSPSAIMGLVEMYRETGQKRYLNCAKLIVDSRGKPFFMAIGISKPHLTWYVPQKYFDMYPLDEIVLPKTMARLKALVPRTEEPKSPENLEPNKQKDTTQ